MKRQLPILLCSILGFCLILQYFVPHTLSQGFETRINDWLRIITVFAFVIGLGSLIRVHLRRVVMRADHWHYSLVVFFGIFLFPLAALIDYATTPDPLATILGSTNFSDGQLTADIRSTLEEQGLKLAPNIRVRSKRDQWQLQEQKLRFSFTFIESEIIPSLNNRLITTDLRQLFADNKHTLPSDIQVQVQKKGQKYFLFIR